MLAPNPTEENPLDVLAERLVHLPPPALSAYVGALPPRHQEVVTAALERYRRRQLNYLADPVRWAHDRLGIELWSKQREIIESVRDFKQTAVHSCHDAGKSFCAALAVAWWLDVHDPGKAFALTTAPTGAQVKAILWREIGKLHRAGGLPGRVNLTEWYIGDELVGMGRKPAEHADSNFAGIHAEQGVIVVIDEACGVPKGLWDGASSQTSNDSSRILAIGNPDNSAAHFADVCLEQTETWNVIHIAAKHTPNFSGEPLPPAVLASLLSPSWVADRALEWGTDSAIYVAKVDGLFPTDAEDGMIPMSFVSMARYLDLPPEPGPRVIGVDFGAGGDLTVVRERVGRKVGREWTLNEKDPEKVADFVTVCAMEAGAERMVCDGIGIGHGIVGLLRKAGREGRHNARVVPFIASEASTEKKPDGKPVYQNKRAEMWWRGRTLSRLQQWDLTGVDDRTIAELILTKKDPNAEARRGVIQAENKEEIRKRTRGKSTDHADALLQAFWEESTPSRVAVPQGPLTIPRGRGAPRGQRR